jgi:4-carboxymuconolactone decarboxylase
LEMKSITAVLIAISLCASIPAQTTPPSSATPDSQKIKITRNKSLPSRPGPAENFTGAVRVDPLFQANAPSRMTGSYVTFEPRARAAWHSHPLGQILIVTAGVGRVQRWGDPIDEIRPGDVVWIPPGEKHWHGAGPETSMTHIAMVESTADGKSTDWMEKVTDAQYGGRVQSPQTAATVRPTAGKQLMGDIAPKLADLTDDVLFADVWERPGLSKRDRSIATVAALIAMNRPDQLRSHMARARDNGVTEQELIEEITHLAFYAGWPSAVTAVGVAREVFQKK